MRNVSNFIFLAALMLLLATGCNRAPTAVADETQSTSPTATEALDQAAETPTDPATEVPEATALPVASPLPTFTPLPTAVPAPFQGQSVMGVELWGQNIVSQIPPAASGGAFWVRWNGILWSDVEPNEGDRIWEALGAYEQQFQDLAANDLKLIAIVRSTPRWAQAVPGKFCGPVAEAKLAAFGEFMFDLVSRYSREPYHIKYWELGNEPDVDPSLVPPNSPFGCMGDKNDPFYGGGAYARLLNAVYPRIKAADPEAQLLVGGLLMDCDPVDPPETAPGSGVPKYCDPSRFIEGILANGGGDSFDGISFHAYDFYNFQNGFFANDNWHSGFGSEVGLFPVLVAKSRYLKNILAQYGYFNKSLFNTETALLCGSTGQEPFCQGAGFNQMKADYVPITYSAALAEGLQGNIWFYLQGGWRRSGLIQNNGSPLSAYGAFQFASQMLDGKVFWGQVSGADGVAGYMFRQGDQETWVLWSSDGNARLMEVDRMPTAVFSALGVPQNPTQTLEITISPIYVAWAP